MASFAFISSFIIELSFTTRLSRPFLSFTFNVSDHLRHSFFSLSARRPAVSSAWLDAGIFGWIFDKPLRDGRHVRLERTRYRKVEHPGPYLAAVFKVVSDTARDKNE